MIFGRQHPLRTLLLPSLEKFLLWRGKLTQHDAKAQGYGVLEVGGECGQEVQDLTFELCSCHWLCDLWDCTSSFFASFHLSVKKGIIFMSTVSCKSFVFLIFTMNSLFILKWARIINKWYRHSEKLLPMQRAQGTAPVPITQLHIFANGWAWHHRLRSERKGFADSAERLKPGASVYLPKIPHLFFLVEIRPGNT